MIICYFPFFLGHRGFQCDISVYRIGIGTVACAASITYLWCKNMQCQHTDIDELKHRETDLTYFWFCFQKLKCLMRCIVHKAVLECWCLMIIYLFIFYASLKREHFTNERKYYSNCELSAAHCSVSCSNKNNLELCLIMSSQS